MVFRHMKKAQAAMEFLMTYSWAILAVLVVIGALVYFGVFDFENFFPDRCALGHPLQCVDNSLSQDANNNITISFLISNQDQRSLNITNVSITSEALNGPCYVDNVIEATGNGSDNPNGTLDRSSIGKGESQTVRVKRTATSECGPSDTISRNKNKYEVTVEYYYTGSNEEFKHQVKGEILATTSKRGQ